MKRSDVYKAIRDKLLEDKRCLPLTVDVNLGQMKSRKEDYPLPFPIALINVTAVTWKTISGIIQKGIVTIEVDYFKVHCQNTFSGAEAEDDALSLLDSPDDIYKSLQGYEVPGLLGELRRTAERQINADDMVIGYRISFEADVYEQ